MRLASVYKLPNRFIIHSLSKTKIGSIASPPYLTIDINAPMEEVIKNLITAMDATKVDVDDPNPDSTLQDYLDHLGMKNKKELYKDSILCTIFEKDNIITFLPTVNHGARGFINRDDKLQFKVPSNADVSELCNALVEALSMCE